MKKYIYSVLFILAVLVAFQVFTTMFAVAWKLATWIILIGVVLLLAYVGKWAWKYKFGRK